VYTKNMLHQVRQRSTHRLPATTQGGDGGLLLL
jgi:hypothetical protein